MAAKVRWLLAFLLPLLALTEAVMAQEVRIVAVDGRLDPSGQIREVQVQPGQVVSLTADEIWRDAAGSPEYAYRDVEDFLWESSVSPGDRCDPATDCRAVSNFEVTEFGVNYYVPLDPPSRITLTVTTRWGGDRDRVVLVNERALSSSQEYRNLDGLGRWVVLAGDRVFVPYVGDPGWSPYTRGYWYWSAHGWTWYSYDPWGYMTDHFGHWRHSHLYGWVWIPDPLWVWRPAVVTFFFGSSWIGWYPYDPGWAWGYRHGYAHGYDDGYWAGYRAGRHDGRRGHHHRGHVMVGYRDFYVPGDRRGPPDRAGRPAARATAAHDISAVRVRDTELLDREVNAAFGRGDFGAVPGGFKDLSASRSFIAERTGVRVDEVRMDRVGLSPGASDRVRYQPKQPLFEMPKSYVDVRAATLREVRGDRASGLRVNAPLARPDVTRKPGDAIRGVAPAPVRRDAASRTQATWLPKSSAADRPDARTPDAARDVRAVPGAVRPQPSAVRPSDTGRTVPDVRRDATGSGSGLYRYQGTPSRDTAPAVETRAPVVTPQRRPDVTSPSPARQVPGAVRSGGAQQEDEDALRRRSPTRAIPQAPVRDGFRRDVPTSRPPARPGDSSSSTPSSGVRSAPSHSAVQSTPTRSAVQAAPAARSEVRSSGRIRQAPATTSFHRDTPRVTRSGFSSKSSGTSSSSSSSSSSYVAPSRSSAPARAIGGGSFGRSSAGGRSAPAPGGRR